MKEAVEGIDQIKILLDKLILLVSQLIGSPLVTIQKWLGSGGKSTGSGLDALQSGSTPSGAKKGDF